MSTAQAHKSMNSEFLTQPTKQVEAYLAQVLDQRALPSNLREAARYALLGPGKRLRPILTLHCAAAVGTTKQEGAQEALTAAAGIEMIHCFSLVHDDLPAMDDDDLRRGRPTLHIHCGEAMAILAGDLLMGLAFELIATTLEPKELAGRVSAELAIATNDMIAGQVYDTIPDLDDELEPMDRLATNHRHKTGAGFQGACRMGAICGGGDEAQLEAITQYAQTIGLMFQIVDDLLDVTQTTEQLGKAAGKDAEQGKATYPGLLGVEPSRQEVKRLQAQAHDSLSQFDSRADPLRDLCDLMAVRQK
jgi:geranylgeranyl pyrophosphate synthase